MLTPKKLVYFVLSCLAVCASTTKSQAQLTDSRTTNIHYSQNTELGKTIRGRKLFAAMCKSPIATIETLKKRQNLIRTLLNDPELMAELGRIFDEWTRNEGPIETDLTPALTDALEKILEAKPTLASAYAEASAFTHVPAHAHHEFWTELDVYVSVAQSMINTPRPSCFVEFIEDPNATSTVQATNIGSFTTYYDLKENLQLGTDAEHPRSAAVPITTYKDMVFWREAFIENIVLAQTFGIASAESFKLTPFTHFSLLVPAPVVEGKSNFATEAEFLVNITTEIRNLSADERALIVTDFCQAGPAQMRHLLPVTLANDMAQQQRAMYIHLIDYDQPAIMLSGPTPVEAAQTPALSV